MADKKMTNEELLQVSGGTGDIEGGNTKYVIQDTQLLKEARTPTKKGDVTGRSLCKGDKVSVISVSGEFSYVRLMGDYATCEGYVFSNYLSDTKPC